MNEKVENKNNRKISIITVFLWIFLVVTMVTITLGYTKSAQALESSRISILSVMKIWEDENNEFGDRPESVILQIKDGENVISEAEVNESNNWSYEFEVPKYGELGNEIVYTVDEKETSEFYDKIIDGYTVINRYNNYDPDGDIERISITKTSDKEFYYTGDKIYYTIKIENDSGGNVYGVTVKDELPYGLEFVEASEGGIYYEDDWTVVWTVNLPRYRI